MKPRLVITMGDPAGIGPELCCRVCTDSDLRERCQPLVVGSRALLQRVAEAIAVPPPAQIVEPDGLALDAAAVEPGRPAAACGAAALVCVEHALALVRDGDCAALVTAPLNKAAVAASGARDFVGHTELLAQRCGVERPVMLLYDERIAVVPITGHQSLRSVPDALDEDAVMRSARLLHDALTRLRGRAPRLALCGLNPHAGEDGLFGDEEQRILAPVVARLREQGIAIDGPIPADSAFTPTALERYDGHLACYHDQGLIPFKALAFASGVNTTLGLPIVRCSPDHGTAFDRAWQGTADAGSMRAACFLALRMSAAAAE